MTGCSGGFIYYAFFSDFTDKSLSWTNSFSSSSPLDLTPPHKAPLVRLTLPPQGSQIMLLRITGPIKQYEHTLKWSQFQLKNTT